MLHQVPAALLVEPGRVQLAGFYDLLQLVCGLENRQGLLKVAGAICLYATGEVSDELIFTRRGFALFVKEFITCYGLGFALDPHPVDQPGGKPVK